MKLFWLNGTKMSLLSQKISLNLFLKKEKNIKSGNKKVKISPIGKKQDQEDLGLQILGLGSIKVPLNTRKRKTQKKKDDNAGFNLEL